MDKPCTSTDLPEWLRLTPSTPKKLTPVDRLRHFSPGYLAHETGAAVNRDLAVEEKLELFLDLISRGEKPVTASRIAGISVGIVNRLRRDDPTFAQRWDDAEHISLDQLEQEAWRRAMSGSDKLLMFVLERCLPRKYGRPQSLAPGDTGAPDTDAQRKAKLDALLAIAKGRSVMPK